MNMHDTGENQATIAAIIHPFAFPHRQRRSQRQRISPSPEPTLLTAVHPAESKMIESTNPPSTENVSDHDVQISSTLNNVKKTPSIADLDPVERKKQIALNKVQMKLDKAQRLYQSAQSSLEQNISEFLRVTTLPAILTEPNSSKITNAAYDKRIRELQEMKKELEKKIANYQSDLVRIQSGDIPNRYSSSKNILNNLKDKVIPDTKSKHRSADDISTPPNTETTKPTNSPATQLSESDHFPTKSTNTSSAPSHALEPVVRSSPSNSICNEIGKSHFYINPTHDTVYETEKNSRRYDTLTTDDLSASHDYDKSPSTKRRFTDDSNTDFNDHTSDHSSDDRYASFNASKRNTMTSHEHHQLMVKIDLMQKKIDQYEIKMSEMQTYIDLLNSTSESQRDEIERLKNEMTDLTDLRQIEMGAMRADLKKLEHQLIYNVQEYWNEMVEKLEKLDTRTTKVEQTQTHSLETEENTHRIITKLVNILLTVFAIILLLLSTIKNLIQSRVHAVVLLILVFIWIIIHYLPENSTGYLFLTNLTHRFKSNAVPSD